MTKSIKNGDWVEIRLPWYKKLRARLNNVELPPAKGIVTRTWEESDDDSFDIVTKRGEKFRVAAEYVYLIPGFNPGGFVRDAFPESSHDEGHV